MGIKVHFKLYNTKKQIHKNLSLAKDIIKAKHKYADSFNFVTYQNSPFNKGAQKVKQAVCDGKFYVSACLGYGAQLCGQTPA